MPYNNVTNQPTDRIVYDSILYLAGDEHSGGGPCGNRYLSVQ
jgi:hypothetical protein